jgi:hypothetical protein
MSVAARPESSPAGSVRSAPTPRELLRTLHALTLGALLGAVLLRVGRAGGGRPAA